MILVLPIWLTIVAFGEESALVWKDFLNSELAKVTSRKIQVVEVSEKSIQSMIPTAGDHIEVDLQNIKAQGFSNLFVRILNSKNEIRNQMTIQARLSIQTLVPLSLRRFQKGDLISASDYKWEWREASQSTMDVLTDRDVDGRVARGVIVNGEMILPSKVESPTLVNRGDRVAVVILSNGLKVSGVGVAEQSGGRGQSIKVMNLDSKKEIIGVVSDQRVVEVRL